MKGISVKIPLERVRLADIVQEVLRGCLSDPPSHSPLHFWANIDVNPNVMTELAKYGRQILFDNAVRVSAFR
jgi:hypothetical protein